jgi:MFS family permease
MMGAMFLLPVFAQTYLGLNATQTGLLFIPMALSMFVAAPLGGYLSRKISLKYLVSLGMTISAFGIFLFSGLDVKTTAMDLIIPLVIFALGMGLGMAPMTAAATNSVPTNEVGVSSALLNLVRNIAGAVGIAFFSTVLSNIIESNVLQLGQDAIINTTNPQVIQTVSALIILKAQVMAYGDVFVIAACIMSTGIIVALFLKQPK